MIQISRPWSQQPSRAVRAGRRDLVFHQAGARTSHGMVTLNNGASFGMTAQGTGILNESYLDSYASVPAALGTGAWTQGSVIVGVYVNAGVANNTNTRIFAEESASALRGFDFVMLRLDTSGGVYLGFFRAGSTSQMRYSAAFTLAAGYYVFGASWFGTANTDIVLYVNGISAGVNSTYPGTSGSGLYSDATQISLGGIKSYARSFNGLIYCAYVFNRGLSAAEHYALYRNPWAALAPTPRVVALEYRRRNRLALLI